MEKDRTINSREVAEMIEKRHSDLLGDIRKYVSYMGESNERKIPSVDFFMESAYIDNKGEARPCYEVTRKGCEFIANKLTGQKGTLFTAAYINKFHELESRQAQLHQPYDTVKAFGLGEVSNLLKLLVSVMNKQNSTGHKIAEQVKLTCGQFGVQTISDFVEPTLSQMSLLTDISKAQ